MTGISRKDLDVWTSQDDEVYLTRGDTCFHCFRQHLLCLHGWRFLRALYSQTYQSWVQIWLNQSCLGISKGDTGQKSPGIRKNRVGTSEWAFWKLPINSPQHWSTHLDTYRNRQENVHRNMLTMRSDRLALLWVFVYRQKQHSENPCDKPCYNWLLCIILSISCTERWSRYGHESTDPLSSHKDFTSLLYHFSWLKKMPCWVMWRFNVLLSYKLWRAMLHVADVGILRHYQVDELWTLVPENNHGVASV